MSNLFDDVCLSVFRVFDLFVEIIFNKIYYDVIMLMLFIENNISFVINSFINYIFIVLLNDF